MLRAVAKMFDDFLSEGKMPPVGPVGGLPRRRLRTIGETTRAVTDDREGRVGWHCKPGSGKAEGGAKVWAQN